MDWVKLYARLHVDSFWKTITPSFWLQSLVMGNTVSVEVGCVK